MSGCCDPFVPGFGASDGAGGDMIGVNVLDEGVAIPGNPHTTLNFIGNGIVATDAGLGVANITVTSTAIIAFGNNSVAAAADTRFLDQWSSTTVAGTPETTPIVAPRAGTLRNLFVRHQASVGNGNSVVYRVRINGVNTAITVTLASGAIAQASDLVNTAAVAQGDRITLSAVKALALGNGAVIPSATLEFI